MHRIQVNTKYVKKKVPLGHPKVVPIVETAFLTLAMRNGVPLNNFSFNVLRHLCEDACVGFDTLSSYY